MIRTLTEAQYGELAQWAADEITCSIDHWADPDRDYCVMCVPGIKVAGYTLGLSVRVNYDVRRETLTEFMGACETALMAHPHSVQNIMIDDFDGPDEYLHLDLSVLERNINDKLN